MLLTPTPLEQCEGLEQLRVLEHGYSIIVQKTQKAVLEINTPADLLLAKYLPKALLNHDSNSNYKHSFDWGWLSPGFDWWSLRD